MVHSIAWKKSVKKFFLLSCEFIQTKKIQSDQISRSVVSNSLRPHESQHLSSPSPLAPNPSQYKSLFQLVNSSHEVAKVLEFQL